MMSERGEMTEEEYIAWVDQRMYEILIGDEKNMRMKGLLSLTHKPEPAKLPEKLTRQLRRQQERINTKGREK